MQATVLADQLAAIHRYYFSSSFKVLLKQEKGAAIPMYTICRYQYGSVDKKEVGIGCGHQTAIIVPKSFHKRKREQLERIAILNNGGMHFGFKLLQRLFYRQIGAS